MKYLEINSNICCDDVIQCIFNLNSQDIIVYKKLKETVKIRADDLEKLLKKDRSTVYRSLQRLTCSGLCLKETKNIQQGGYYHVYFCAKSNEVKENLQNCIDNWYKKMTKTIEEID